MNRRARLPMLLVAAVLTGALLAVDCCSGEEDRQPEKAAGKLQVTSTAFRNGSSIPVAYTCDGEDLSPPLQWQGMPEGTRSLALICDDPDAPVGTWVHWVVYNVDPKATDLPEGVAAVDSLATGARQGVNDFRRIGYGGPCPPQGTPHHYYFKLYALDARIDPGDRASKKALISAMEGHILAEARLIGTYQRR